MNMLLCGTWFAFTFLYLTMTEDIIDDLPMLQFPSNLALFRNYFLISYILSPVIYC